MTVIANRQERLKNQQVTISCVVPIHNEQVVISDFLQALLAKLASITKHHEIIVIDDGSKDESVEIVKTLTQQYPIKLISLSRNFGKEAALTAGIDHCNSDVTILIDSDFQHPLDMIPVFLEKWVEGYEMVYGVRKNRTNESLGKRLFTKVFYGLMKVGSDVDIPADAGDYRLLSAKVVNALKNMDERGRFMKGLYAWVGFKSIAVPFDVEDRKAGKSSWRFRHLTELALTGITSFSDVPLRVWSFVGLIVSAISLAYALFIILKTLIYGNDIPGYATIVVAIMFFGGIQLLSIGVLGEYIARIFNEVKKRPTYIVAERDGFEKKGSGIED